MASATPQQINPWRTSYVLVSLAVASSSLAALRLSWVDVEDFGYGAADPLQLGKAAGSAASPGASTAPHSPNPARASHRSSRDESDGRPQE